MLIPNNPDIDFTELNQRIAAQANYYRGNMSGNLPLFSLIPAGQQRAATWQGLLAMEGEMLIDSGFPLLLGRDATEAERQHWHSELLGGRSKFEFLASLRYSREGQKHGAQTHGLRKARLKNLVRSVPVLGKLVFSAYGWLAIEARHRAYMARLHALEAQSRSLAHAQNHTQHQSQGQIQALNHELLTTRQQTEQLLLAQRKQQLVVELQQQSLHVQQERLQAQEELLNQMQALAEQFSARLSDVGSVAQELRSRLSQLEAKSSPSAAVVAGETAFCATAPVTDAFYLAFENRFRGEASVIRERLSYYLPILEQCRPLQENLPLVDIGCGRGEWLAMLPGEYAHIGIDLNAMNVRACHELGLQAEVGNGLTWLAKQPDNSLGAITAFHVIEHLRFEDFYFLLDQCNRVLVPGGMLIFETPNPENLISAATNFYTDPTHLHPLPPAFTEFLVQFKGFDDVSIHRLNPIPREYALNEDTEVARRCDALFYGPQDYAVIARKVTL